MIRNSDGRISRVESDRIDPTNAMHLFVHQRTTSCRFPWIVNMTDNSSVFCSIFESNSDREARLCISQMQSHPIPIWWYRRRVNAPEQNAEKEDLSPFPKSWSLNYSPGAASEFRKAVGVMDDEKKEDEAASSIKPSDTNESSIYSTASQEQRNKQKQMRDDKGYCIKHPSVKMAEKRQVRKPRLSKLFGKHQRKSISNESTKDALDEWIVLLEECPECKLDSISNSKRIDPKSSSTVSITYEPFPATITIVESHSHLLVGSYALQIRTKPVPVESTRRLSCILDNDKGNMKTHWTTPDGALDFVLPSDSEGNILANGKESEQSTSCERFDCKHCIMERIIPLSSIDHISRGGDAWDVLRQSAGEEDLGCRCDLKIHGFSDRVLRFDVVGFGNQNNKENNADNKRQSFAMVDFLRSSMSSFTNKDNKEDEGISTDAQWDLGNYTKENVMTKMNSLVMWDRDRRETGVEGYADCFSTFVEECCSLGVPSSGKKFVPVTKKQET